MTHAHAPKFFKVKDQITLKQKVFIERYYPEYLSKPNEILTKLFYKALYVENNKMEPGFERIYKH